MFLKEYAENKETLDYARLICDAWAREMEAGGSKVNCEGLGKFEARLGYE